MTRRRKQKAIQTSYDPPDYAQESDISRFDNMKILAYSGIFVVFGVAISLNDFKHMWTLPASEDRAIFIARIVLFAVMLVFAARFVIATHHELRMWIRWLKNPVEKQEVYASFFCLALILGLSLAFPHKIAFIAGFITTAFLFLYWAQWLANDHLHRALLKTRETHLSNSRRKVLDTMEHYWLKRPQLARLATMMYVSSASFALALAGMVEQGSRGRHFQVAAYWVLITDIFIGEVVITWWRYRLEADLRIALQS